MLIYHNAEKHKEFKTCAVDNPVTSKLFSDDLDKQIKEITDARRISRKIVHSNGTDRNNHYVDKNDVLSIIFYLSNI